MACGLEMRQDEKGAPARKVHAGATTQRWVWGLWGAGGGIARQGGPAFTACWRISEKQVLAWPQDTQCAGSPGCSAAWVWTGLRSLAGAGRPGLLANRGDGL